MRPAYDPGYSRNVNIPESATEQMVRMSDVAQRAGVSRATVSRVLSGSASVSNATQEKVLAAVKQLGYVPNVMAQTLAHPAHNKDLLVGSLIRDPRRASYGLLFSELQKNADEQGVELLTVAPTQGQSTPGEQHGLHRLLSVRVKGLLVATGVIASEDLWPFIGKVPIVSVGRPEVNPQVYGVSYDEEATGRLLANAVVGHGHRDIAVIAPSREVSVPEHTRAQSIISSLRTRGINPIVIEAPTFGVDNEGIGETVQLVRKKMISVAMFPTDDRALRFMELALKSGIEIPRDVSVTGADGIANGINIISLATVRIPTETVAERAITVMKSLIENPNTPIIHEKYSGMFVDGRTLAAPGLSAQKVER